MGRTVDDVARLFAVLAGQSPVDRSASAPSGSSHATTWRTDHPPTDAPGRGVRRSAARAPGTPVERRDVADARARCGQRRVQGAAGRAGGRPRCLPRRPARRTGCAPWPTWSPTSRPTPGSSCRASATSCSTRHWAPAAGPATATPAARARNLEWAVTPASSRTGRRRRAGRPRLRAGLEERPGRRRARRGGVELGDDAGRHRRVADHERAHRHWSTGCPIGLALIGPPGRGVDAAGGGRPWSRRSVAATDPLPRPAGGGPPGAEATGSAPRRPTPLGHRSAAAFRLAEGLPPCRPGCGWPGRIPRSPTCPATRDQRAALVVPRLGHRASGVGRIRCVAPPGHFQPPAP